MDEGLRIFSIISHARRRSLITPHRKNGESRITMRHSPFSLQNSTFQFSLCAPKSTTSFPKKSSAAGAASDAAVAFLQSRSTHHEKMLCTFVLHLLLLYAVKRTAAFSAAVLRAYSDLLRFCQLALYVTQLPLSAIHWLLPI